MTSHRKKARIRSARVIKGGKSEDSATHSVTGHGSELGSCLDVPDLDFSEVVTDREVGAVSRPGEGRDLW